MRVRRDGWTPERQQAFIAALRRTLCVTAASRAVGMARETAYRLRARPDASSFAGAWDAAMARRAPMGPSSTAMLWHRALYGVAKQIVRRGEVVGEVVTADNAALLKLYNRFERLAKNIEAREKSR